jgi:hypothetical protein
VTLVVLDKRFNFHCFSSSKFSTVLLACKLVWLRKKDINIESLIKAERAISMGKRFETAQFIMP